MNVERSYDDNGQVRYTVSTPKKKIKYFVQKAFNGFVFYEIVLEKGAAPKELQGSYTSPEKALDRLRKYLVQAKNSTTVERDRKYQKNHAPEVKPDSTEHVQQGTPD